MASSASKTTTEHRVRLLVDRLIQYVVGVSRPVDDAIVSSREGDDVHARRLSVSDDDSVAGMSDRERKLMNDENFKLCEAYCDYHLRVHTFRDVERADVEIRVRELSKRMEATNRTAHGLAIERRAMDLIGRWDDAETEEASDVGARVVTMLLGLAGRPLAANVEVGDDEVGSDEELGERIAGAFGGMTFAEDEDVTSFDEVGDENGFASDSTLSVWSESDEDYIVDVKDCRRGDEMATSEIPPSESMSEGEDPGFSWEDNLLVQDSAPESTMCAIVPRAERAPEVVSEVVFQARRLQNVLGESHARKSDASLLVTTPAKSVQSETALVRGALHALRAGGEDLERVSLPHVSCVTLDGALASIRRVVAVLVRVREINQASLKFGPTIQAFAHALDARGRALMSELAPLEKRLSSDSTTAPPTLLELRATVRKLETKVDAVEHVALNAFPMEGTPAAEAASHCLSAVYEAVSYHQATANIDGFAVTLRVFVDTLQPYMETLHRWLAFGVLDDPSEELFIAKGRAVDDFVGSKEHWLHGYVLRHDIETPCFLREFAVQTLDIGRSIVLLHHTESQTGKVPKLEVHLCESFCEQVRVALGATRDVVDDVMSIEDLSKRASDLISTVKVESTGLIGVFQNYTSLVGVRSISTEQVRDTIVSQPTRIVASRNLQTKTPLQACVDELNSWLDKFLTKQVPACPMHLMVQGAIGSFITRRADEIMLVLSKALRDELNIEKELYALRAVFLGGAGDAATHFYSAVFNILDDPVKIKAKWNDATLNELLVDAFSMDNSGEFPKDRGVQVEIVPEAERNLFSRVVLGTGALEKIASMRFSFDVKWPHNIVVPPSAMAQYNAVAVFLGQLRRAHIAMQTVSTARWSERIRCSPGSGLGGARARHLEPRLRRFVASLREHVLVNILHTDWNRLILDIDAALSLDAMRAAHDAFLNDATKRCLVSPDPTWTLLSEQIRTTLAVACEYAACQGGDGAVSEEDATRLSTAFEEAYAYIERVLQAKLDVGSASTQDAEDLLYAIRLN